MYIGGLYRQRDHNDIELVKLETSRNTIMDMTKNYPTPTTIIGGNLRLCN